MHYLINFIKQSWCRINVVFKSKCEICIKSVKNDTGNKGKESELVNLKNRGFLIYPNNNLFKILHVLETCFCKHVSSADVFENTYNEFLLHVTNLPFPCTDHKHEIMTEISLCIF